MTQEKNQEKQGIVEKLNDSIQLGIEASNLEGFDRAFKLAQASESLQNLLTEERMKPIMNLQNKTLGFRTDKDAGYNVDTVKNALIEAVLTGVQPVNNHFNIIAGNCYITKEGFGYLLKNVKGLTYEIIPELPRTNNERGKAAIVMDIRWKYNGQEDSRRIDFPIRVNKYMTEDAIIGKATRKARKWLYEKIMNIEVADGDISDVKMEQKEKEDNKKEKKDEELNNVFNDNVSDAEVISNNENSNNKDNTKKNETEKEETEGQKIAREEQQQKKNKKTGTNQSDSDENKSESGGKLF